MIRIILLLFLYFCSASVLFSQKLLINWTDANVGTYVKSGNTFTDFKVIDGVLQITVKETGKLNFSVNIPEYNKDISKNTSLNIPVANTGNTECRVSARLNDKKWVAGAVVLQPGESDRLEILFLHKVDKTSPYFTNMDGVPGGGLYIWDPIDPEKLAVIQIEIETHAPVTIAVGNITADGSFQSGEQVASQVGFFPFIDEYGQYKHKEWPAKVHADKDLEENLRSELNELALLKDPKNFNKYGGWEDGPKLTPTGNFYVEKVNGVWWFVDPEGKLFWSHGVNGGGFGSGTTQISGRGNYFTRIPTAEPRFNFYSANLTKKFGDKWMELATAHIHNRLRSWGMNTMTSRSDPNLSSMRTPYTARVGYQAPALDGRSYKFPDVFDPRFKESLDSGIKRSVEVTKNDSWCIGYFIDNELYLSDFAKWPEIIMKQKPDGAAKKALIGYIRSKYNSIRTFNNKYKSKIGSWDQLLKDTILPEAAVRDFSDFNQMIVDKYFSTCRNAIKESAPNKLYMGNRFNLYRIYYPYDTLINYAIRRAAEYCDVVSINYYRFTCEDLLLPEGIDKPIIIGEFHFGALDRGLTHTGLRNVANQEQRAEFYQYYVEQALKNPQIIGTHWFQYIDEPYTSRSDGENYQIGLVDVCDTPYPETIRAIRNIGYNMYYLRYKK